MNKMIKFTLGFCLGLLITGLLSEKMVSAAKVDFTPETESRHTLEGIYWLKGPIEVEKQSKNGRNIRIAKLKGVYLQEHASLISKTSVMNQVIYHSVDRVNWKDYRGQPLEDPHIPAPRVLEKQTQEKPGYRLVEIDVVLNDTPVTNVILIAVLSNGTTQQTDFDLKLIETPSTFWDERVLFSVPFGTYTNTNPSGTAITTSIGGYAYELKAEITRSRAIHDFDRTLELYASASLGYIVPFPNLTFPLYGRGEVQARWKNLLGSAGNGGSHGISPFIGAEGNSIPIAAPLLVATSSGQMYQVRTLLLLWVTAGFVYRIQSESRWWEFIPTFS